jgi:hypothetical protein
MLDKYREWISLQKDVAGNCYVISCDMVKQFPELHIVIGEVFTEFGYCNHTWCCDGINIIDPTVSQFKIIKSYRTRGR